MPLPESTNAAVSFIAKTDGAAAKAFWSEHLSRLGSLVAVADQINSQWGDLIPSEIRPSAGKLKLAAFLSHMLRSGLGGSRWWRQFIFGFELAGVLSQSGTSPVDSRTDDKLPASDVKLFSAAQSRFRERPNAACRKNGKLLWVDAIDRWGKGWLSPPVLIGSTAAPTASPINYAFRFGVEKGSKLRACGDLEHPLTNLSCIVCAPVKLVSCGQVAELRRLSASSKGDWQFPKADHEAAYKQLPLKWGNSRMKVMMLRRPTAGYRYSIRSRAMLFGAVAAVLHYNVFIIIAAELITKISSIQIISFFYDFGALAPGPLAREALAAFNSFCELLCIRLKHEKEDVGPHVNFLGLRGFFPCASNSWKLQISPPTEKAEARPAFVRSFRLRGSIHAMELECLIGRLCFSQTCLFGKFARTQMRFFYKNLRIRVFVAKFAQRELLAPPWR